MSSLGYDKKWRHLELFRLQKKIVFYYQKKKINRDVIVQSSDKTIRLYWLDDEKLHNSELLFAETVNKNNWNQCCFSQVGEYIIGGKIKKQTHWKYPNQ